MKQKNAEFLTNIFQGLLVGIYTVITTALSQVGGGPAFYLMELLVVTVIVMIPLTFDEVFTSKLLKIGGALTLTAVFTAVSWLGNSVTLAERVMMLAGNSLIVTGGMAFTMLLHQDFLLNISTTTAEGDTAER